MAAAFYAVNTFFGQGIGKILTALFVIKICGLLEITMRSFLR